ncbi:MAG: cytochrome c family protein, partial [Candidatus Marinimicrobia bacterium]|nr:cytochrome c family protein [Candidatus Neomarinimicrobiota bacterium]
KYVVAEAEYCRRCHKSKYEKWKTTPHAMAFETLVHEHKDKQDRCVRCHVTGWQKSPGFWDQNLSPEFRDVQCTECHYVPLKHLKNPKKYHPQKIQENTCTRCHHKPKDDDFDFERDVKIIRH